MEGICRRKVGNIYIIRVFRGDVVIDILMIAPVPELHAAAKAEARALPAEGEPERRRTGVLLDIGSDYHVSAEITAGAHGCGMVRQALSVRTEKSEIKNLHQVK
jgi:hypothetical protein